MCGGVGDRVCVCVCVCHCVCVQEPVLSHLSKVLACAWACVAEGIRVCVLECLVL